LIQGYDFLHLNREKGINLQICGSDQWGNSLSGVDLIRKLEGKEAHIWTAPLVIDQLTGKKFGKSENGTIWLDEQKTSVYKFYQFWLNTSDESVISFLKLYTLLKKDEIKALVLKTKSLPQERLAQKTLAYEVTKIVHGENRAHAARRVTQVLFGSLSVGELNYEDIEMLKMEIPVIEPGLTLIRTLLKSGLASSSSEALRLLKAGAIYIDGKKHFDDFEIKEGPLLIKRGKNAFCLVD
jgi:tyrosyl-tRNA synthetase